MTKRDGIIWNAFAHVDKYDAKVVQELTHILGYEPKAADFARLGVEPNDTAEAEGNLLCKFGLANITNRLISGGTAMSATLSFVGVGSSATTATNADTVLGGNGSSTTAWYQVVDSIPLQITTSQSNDTIQCISTFVSANGNFVWNEWCWGLITSGTTTASGTLASVGTGAFMVNHKIASLGTKALGASWVFTTTVQFQ